MKEFIIVAGPQAAGKSTLISRLKEQGQRNPESLCDLHPLFPLQECRQIVSHQFILLGAIFMTPEQESLAISYDFARMDSISSRRGGNHITYVDECNIFSIAHAAAHGISEDKFWDNYLKRLYQFRTRIIYIDLPAEISWERRHRVYEQRLVYFPKRQHAEIMRRYHAYLIRLQVSLNEMFDRIPFPKTMIDGRQDKEIVYRQVLGSLLK